jgi:uncharacterized protein YjdB
LLFVQPILAISLIENNVKDSVLIAAEISAVEETHDGFGGSSGQGGNGQGGSGKGGVNGSGGTGGSGGSGSGSGSSGNSEGSGGGNPDTTEALKTLNVTVVWPENVEHPAEVEVTLMNSDSSESILTVDGKVTFYTEPGNEWVLVGESVPGFIIPEANVAIKGTDEVISATLIYEVGTIHVESIELSKTTLELLIGYKTILNAKVYPTNANNKSLTWVSSSPEIVSVNNGVVEALSVGTATITVKSVDMESITATCNVTVKSLDSAIRVTGVTLNTDSVNLNLGDNDTYEFIATIRPENATVKDVLWNSSDESVVSVDQLGIVTAKSTGYAVITVTTLDGGYKGYAQVSVGAAPEISYIFPCLEDSYTEHFDDPYKVFINVEELVKKIISEGSMTDDGVAYYVKVTEKGSTDPLGEGLVKIYEDTIMFSLYDITKFTATENYSDRYFVYMSQDPNYPKDDEKTLMTNFMGGSSTPTIPIENVDVSLAMYGGKTTSEGIVFLLAREEFFGVTLEEVSWREFYNGTPPANPYPPNGLDGVDVNSFVDEVKMIGITDQNGVVQWIPPRETLKLGGYLLLEVTPLKYKDNLSMVNPDSDDGELLKQVTLMRDSVIDIKVTNIYIGESSQVGDTVIPPVNDPVDPQNPPVNDPPDPPVYDPEDDVPPSIGTGGGNSSVVSSGGGSSVFNNLNTDIVKIDDTAKFKDHWSKSYLDNLIEHGNMPRSLFEKITDLNNDVNLSDVVELVEFINDSSEYETPVYEEINIPITRQQAAVLLLKSFDIEPIDNPTLSFIDSEKIDSSAKGYVAAACKLGIISGYPDNTFKPNNTLTKAELFKVVSKCLEVKDSLITE